MANKKHVKILKKGAAAWNAWRQENAAVQPDLSRANLFEADLTGTGFTREHFLVATLTSADLYEVDLTGMDLTGANLTEVNLTEANLYRAHLYGANLTGTDLTRAILTEANLTEANLTRANLYKADLIEAYLTEAIITKANLTRANLIGAHLKGAILTRANLDAANLSVADLTKADLRGVNLTGATLTFADLTGANLTGAILARAILIGADLTGADLTGVLLLETVFTDTNLSGTKGLDQCNHHRPCTLDHRTLAKSGDLPIAFLRGCGLPQSYIDYLPSFLGKPFEFYSCFISYSSNDDNFAKRLHADLQDTGVRCWFAPEDMKTGDRIRHAIHDAIRLHDKLLIILSDDSVQSQWVEDEVERALDREHSEGGTILFPIRLDDAVLDSDSGWASTIKRTRHIGDFTHWKDHDQYNTAFQRLLRDLKA